MLQYTLTNMLPLPCSQTITHKSIIIYHHRYTEVSFTPIKLHVQIYTLRRTYIQNNPLVKNYPALFGGMLSD